MNRKITWIALSAVLMAGCGGNNENGNSYLPMTGKNVTPAEVDRAAKELKSGAAAKIPASTNDFGAKLFRGLAGKELKENIFISPTSVALCLGMVANGAGGETRKSFEKTLGIEGLMPAEANQGYRSLRTVLLSPDPEIKLSIANSLWADESIAFKADFVGKNKDFFGSEVRSLDLQKPEAIVAVNDWVSQATEKMIPKLFDSFKESDIAVAVNAIYFKGAWAEPFNKENTKPATFTHFDGTKTDVQMMSSSDEYSYGSDGGTTVVKIPFGKGGVSMMIVLPDPKSGINGFLKDLTAKKLLELNSKLKSQTGTIKIPRFKFEYSGVLNDQLKAQGLGIAFDSAKADFKPMTAADKVFLDRVIHKAIIAVDEEGAEAAAATGAVAGTESANLTPPFSFVADRPFLFTITENSTNSILFMGVFGKP